MKYSLAIVFALLLAGCPLMGTAHAACTTTTAMGEDGEMIICVTCCNADGGGCTTYCI